MLYEVFVSDQAEKALKKIPIKDYQRIITEVQSLSENPRPAGCKKLKGRPAYRIRIGNYRVIYEIEDNRLHVFVITIGHRKNIYKR